MEINKAHLNNILTMANFDEFMANFSTNGYEQINYGSKVGKIQFNSLFDADKKYKINSNASEENFESWCNILNSPNSNSQDLLITCITIFDWGGVTASNLTKVLEMHKSNELQSYIKFIKSKVNAEELIESKEETEQILWSSGWTKVYSAINTKFIIYDSRVAAYLIYLLDEFYKSNFININYLEDLKAISSYLFTMQNPNRKRTLESPITHKKNPPVSNINAFNGNLVASWIIQFLCENVFIQNNERQFERAFFMLGFDLNQLKIATFKH